MGTGNSAVKAWSGGSRSGVKGDKRGGGVKGTSLMLPTMKIHFLKTFLKASFCLFLLQPGSTLSSNSSAKLSTKNNK